MALWISFPRWEFDSELPIAVRGGAESLKGSHKMGDGRIFLKTFAPLSFIKTFRMDLISARSISLDQWTILSSEMDQAEIRLIR